MDLSIRRLILDFRSALSAISTVNLLVGKRRALFRRSDRACVDVVRRELREGLRDRCDFCWPDESLGLCSIVQEDQSGPELDAERTAESASGSIFHFDVAHTGMVLKGARDERLGSLAVPTPRRTKLEYRRSRERIDLCAGGFNFFETSTQAHRGYALSMR
jgi:hypothetical protein